ncbi:hypothetical protein F5X96DRAFT_695130 [Biscogniauxia mediterranea]|nr:hypothetical protein F5X96DRAFT_695130 [Biscogniauxia mediterranea]
MFFVPNSSTRSPGPNLGISRSVYIHGEYFQGWSNLGRHDEFINLNLLARTLRGHRQPALRKNDRPQFKCPNRADFCNSLSDSAPEFAGVPSLNDLPLYRFLRLFDTTPPAANGGVDLLTPFIYQPYPSMFWTDRVGYESSFVLLYDQNHDDSHIDGGIYVDIRSHQAIWHSGNAPRFPPSDQWLPLEVILLKALDAWATGKSYWDAQETTIKVRG